MTLSTITNSPDFAHANIAQAGTILVSACHDASVNGSWWKDKDGNDVRKDPEKLLAVVGWKLALIHSEVSEATEGIRKNLKDEHLPQHPSGAVELADAIIRIADLAGGLGYDLGTAIADKMAYNAVRADHKPEARAAENGKKY